MYFDIAYAIGCSIARIVDEMHVEYMQRYIEYSY